MSCESSAVNKEKVEGILVIKEEAGLKAWRGQVEKPTGGGGGGGGGVPTMPKIRSGSHSFIIIIIYFLQFV